MKRASNAVPKYEVGGISHLEQLRQLERFFYDSLDFERFYADITKFADEKLHLEDGRPLALDDLREIDGFVRRFFEKKLADVELWVVRGFVLGKLIERGEQVPALRPIRIEDLPTKVREAAREFSLTARETRALEWAVSHGAEHLTNATNDTINTVQQAIFDNTKNRKGYRALRRDLETAFFDNDSELNRNWKRVAISESNNAFNQGYIAQMNGGEWVCGFSLPDACPQCRQLIDGKVYPVIRPEADMSYSHHAPESHERAKYEWLWEHAIWLEKDNFGRSGAERKRINKDSGNQPENLLPREHHEKYMPAIPMHPYCRCRWVRLNPETMYVAGGEMKMRVMNEAAWRAWHDSVILPLQAGLAQYAV